MGHHVGRGKGQEHLRAGQGRLLLAFFFLPARAVQQPSDAAVGVAWSQFLGEAAGTGLGRPLQVGKLHRLEVPAALAIKLGGVLGILEGPAKHLQVALTLEPLLVRGLAIDPGVLGPQGLGVSRGQVVIGGRRFRVDGEDRRQHVAQPELILGADRHAEGPGLGINPTKQSGKLGVDILLVFR